MQDFGKVAVLAGGFSHEREVSLTSGAAVLEALRNKGVDAHLFDPRERPLHELAASGFDRAFNVLHGTFGEDGVVQGVLEAMRIPYTGCGVAASALGMDKFRSRLVWQGCSLPCVPFEVLTDNSDFAAVEARFGLPLFVKPAAEGSSVGVMKIKTPGALQAAYWELKQYHGVVLAEPSLDGGEYTCAVLAGKPLPTIRIIPHNEFYDYEAKYERNDTVYLCPSDLNADEEAQMRALSVKAYEALGCRGWARMDFLRDNTGGIFILEINTVPGMTSHSLVPKAAKETGMDFPDLCLEILRHAALG